MILIFVLWLIAPISIYSGLVLLNNTLLTFILFHGVICLCIPLIDYLLIQKKSIHNYLKDIGLINLKNTILASLLTGLIFGGSIFAFFSILQQYVMDLNQTQYVIDSWNIQNKYLIPFILMMIAGNSILEEIYWRGYLFKKLLDKTTTSKTIILSSIFYTSYHYITTTHLFSILYGIIFTCVIFLIGLFWGYIRYKYHSLYFSIISHLMADLGIMLIYIKYFT